MTHLLRAELSDYHNIRHATAGRGDKTDQGKSRRLFGPCQARTMGIYYRSEATIGRLGW